MVKKLKGKISDDNTTINVIEAARQIWLAGLGAFALAETEGSRFFEMLVKEGEAIEARGVKVAEESIEAVRGKASDTWDKMEQVFQERVAWTLNRLGVPTHEDIHDLTRRIEALQSSIAQLMQVQANEEIAKKSSPRGRGAKQTAITG